MAFTIVQSVTNKAGETDIIPSVTSKTLPTVDVTAVTGDADIIPQVTDKQVSPIAVGTPIGLLLVWTYAT
jgi:hypothetical protein